MKIRLLLCRVGIHRPLTIKDCAFIDQVSHKEVFNAICHCGKRWMVDSPFGWFGFKIEKGK
jgi:hypothetical protein